MRLLVINPNTSAAMTKDIRETIERVKHSDTSITVVSPDFGPEGLESFYDYTLSAFGLCRLLQKEKEQYDGILIACYGDPGLYAAKEICTCPVLGIAETSIALSLLMGSSYAVLAASVKAVPMMENMVAQYGMRERCAGIISLNMGVLDAEANREETIRCLIEKGREAIGKGAEVLILGCAGMTGFADSVQAELGITVIDPVEIAFRTLEMICEGGFSISKKGLYKTPDKKNIKNETLLLK